jgi:hypothetical protein
MTMRLRVLMYSLGVMRLQREVHHRDVEDS